jgi:NCS1 nucleoside transporter family
MATVQSIPEIQAEVREGVYGTRVAAIEPGGAGFIPLNERHGRPLNLFWTWMSPNLEFATIFVGVLAVGVFGMNLWQALVGIVLGTALGSLSHAVLSSRGPSAGVPQMILSRIGFGYSGNILPAGLNAITAGIGWFAVNSVSGALALATLTKLPSWLCLVIVVLAQVVVAFFGHNLVHAFERYAFPILAIIFVVASVIIAGKTDPGHAAGGGGIGGFLVTVGAAFGYAAGWNPYATDYARYLPPKTSRFSTAVWAGLGVFVSCVVLEGIGAASATIVSPDNSNPTAAFTSNLPTAIADLTLLAIALGAVSANALNVYSGAMSFLALGWKVPSGLRRALVSGVFGVLGFGLALSAILGNVAAQYENFLLLIAYWIGPWLGVYFADWYLRRGRRVDGFLYDSRHNPWGGVAAMAIAVGVSVWLFANQQDYKGVVPRANGNFGDIAFEVGFVLAVVLYVVFFRFQRDRDQSQALTVTTAAGT